MIKPLEWLLSTILPARSEERSGALWSFAYFFCLLGAYYILQPLRDAMGLKLGKEYIPSLFRWSLLAMILVNPVFSTMVARMPRIRFIPLVYRFFIVNLLMFVLALHGLDLDIVHRLEDSSWGQGIVLIRWLIPAIYYLWVGVFNLFAVSVFWGLMADVYTSHQGKRLFGFIGAGGTLGQMAGSLVAGQVVEYTGPTNLMIISLILLELGVQCMYKLTGFHDFEKHESSQRPQPKEAIPRPSTDKPTESPMTLPGRPDMGPAGKPEGPIAKAETSGVWDGVRAIILSPYLLGICVYMFLYTFTSSFLYFQRQEIVAMTYDTSSQQVKFFSNVNLVISILTIITQLFITGRIMPTIGLIGSLTLVPIVTCIGFGVLGLYPSLLIVAGFEVTRKVLNYAMARPAREVLYTVVSREEKYKSKSFIDTFVYRSGDALASGAFDGLKAVFSFSYAGISFCAIPFGLLGIGCGTWLGRRQQQMAGPESS